MFPTPFSGTPYVASRVVTYGSAACVSPTISWQSAFWLRFDLRLPCAPAQPS